MIWFPPSFPVHLFVFHLIVFYFLEDIPSELMQLATILLSVRVVQIIEPGPIITPSAAQLEKLHSKLYLRPSPTL